LIHYEDRHQGIGVVAADHEDGAVHGDQPIHQIGEAQARVEVDQHRNSDDRGEHFEEPGEDVGQPMNDQTKTRATPARRPRGVVSSVRITRSKPPIGTPAPGPEPLPEPGGRPRQVYFCAPGVEPRRDARSPDSVTL
jgi:hypothetical protein